jgi:hypothetical protein
MTQVDLARALGISAAMVSKLKARGMPTDDVQSARDWCDRNLRRSLRKGIRGALTTAVVNFVHALAEPEEETPAAQLEPLVEIPKLPEAKKAPAVRVAAKAPSDAEQMRQEWARGGDPYRAARRRRWMDW